VNGSILTFHLCNQLFGIDITTVKEIDRNVEFTPVPDAPPFIVGLLNMRGQIVTLINLAALTGFEHYRNGNRCTCLILKNKTDNSDYIGFLIDNPGSVIDITDENCEPPPANLNISNDHFVREVVKLKDDLVIVIDHHLIYEL
jgi:purine-binding chemotaxis protein CheW